ncbi:MAG: ABC transporter ATP-binding protein [Aeoliella sp.]
MLACKQLTKTFTRGRQQVPVLRGVDLAVAQRECVAIRGSSGSGKTTLLLSLGAMLSPDAGRVEFAQQDVYALSSADRSRLRNQQLGFVFQTFHLIPYLTVLENVMVVTRNQSLSSAARELLTRLGLDHRLDHRPAALSAGEQQRTAIARAMINGPKLILADEPTGNLDAENSAEVYRALGEFRDDGGSVLVVTHGDAADGIADRSLLLNEGTLIA